MSNARRRSSLMNQSRGSIAQHDHSAELQSSSFTPQNDSKPRSLKTTLSQDPIRTPASLVSFDDHQRSPSIHSKKASITTTTQRSSQILSNQPCKAVPATSPTCTSPAVASQPANPTPHSVRTKSSDEKSQIILSAENYLYLQEYRMQFRNHKIEYIYKVRQFLSKRRYFRCLYFSASVVSMANAVRDYNATIPRSSPEYFPTYLITRFACFMLCAIALGTSYDPFSVRNSQAILFTSMSLVSGLAVILPYTMDLYYLSETYAAKIAAFTPTDGSPDLATLPGLLADACEVKVNFWLPIFILGWTTFVPAIFPWSTLLGLVHYLLYIPIWYIAFAFATHCQWRWQPVLLSNFFDLQLVMLIGGITSAVKGNLDRKLFALGRGKLCAQSPIPECCTTDCSRPTTFRSGDGESAGKNQISGAAAEKKQVDGELAEKNQISRAAAEKKQVDDESTVKNQTDGGSAEKNKINGTDPTTNAEQIENPEQAQEVLKQSSNTSMSSKKRKLEDTRGARAVIFGNDFLRLSRWRKPASVKVTPEGGKETKGGIEVEWDRYFDRRSRWKRLWDFWTMKYDPRTIKNAAELEIQFWRYATCTCLFPFRYMLCAIAFNDVFHSFAAGYTSLAVVRSTLVCSVCLVGLVLSRIDNHRLWICSITFGVLIGIYFAIVCVIDHNSPRSVDVTMIATVGAAASCRLQWRHLVVAILLGGFIGRGARDYILFKSGTYAGQQTIYSVRSYNEVLVMWLVSSALGLILTRHRELQNRGYYLALTRYVDDRANKASDDVNGFKLVAILPGRSDFFSKSTLTSISSIAHASVPVASSPIDSPNRVVPGSPGSQRAARLALKNWRDSLPAIVLNNDRRRSMLPEVGRRLWAPETTALQKNRSRSAEKLSGT